MPRSGEAIHFFKDGVKFSLPQQASVRLWLTRVATSKKKKISNLNYIFVSDAVLFKMNKQFLAHETLTDIITFPGETSGSKISGEIYVSIDRVKDNAKVFKQSFRTELARVMAHGLLHLCGFNDKSVKQQKEMRSQEEKALDLRTR